MYGCTAVPDPAAAAVLPLSTGGVDRRCRLRCRRGGGGIGAHAGDADEDPQIRVTIDTAESTGPRRLVAECKALGLGVSVSGQGSFMMAGRIARMQAKETARLKGELITGEIVSYLVS